MGNNVLMGPYCEVVQLFFFVSHQIPALADAGFRVLAPDMKGYGDSTAPPGQLLF